MTQVESVVRGSGLAGALLEGAGAVVAVVRGGETEVVELGQGVEPGTAVQVGSVTKAFTGLLVADAVLRGEITLEATVDELLLGQTATERASKERSVTLRSLVTHTSGLPRVSFLPKVFVGDPYRGYTRERLLRYLERAKPVLPEEPKYSYSNFGYAVVGAMLEKACGATYEELLRERVLVPLGMGDTRLALTGQRVQVERGYAEGRMKRLVVCGRPPVWHFDAYAPCGALVSTAEDLVRFVRELLEEDGAIAEAFGFACVPQAEIPGGAIGLAWHMPESGRYVWHNGATFGHGAYVAVAPGSGVAVIVVANQAVAAPLTQLGHELMRQALA